MCFGGSSGGNDSAAKKAAKEEQERQARLQQGQAGIDAAFEPFDDSYYSDYAQKFQNYYEPQVEDQYRDADAQLKASLARRGVGESSTAANAFGDLFKEFSNTKSTVASDAQTASNDLRSQVSSNKADLIALNAATEDPSLAATEAQSRASTLIAPPQFSSLGDVFASFLAPFKSYSAAKANKSGTPYVSSTGSTSPTGSGSVVR